MCTLFIFSFFLFGLIFYCEVVAPKESGLVCAGATSYKLCRQQSWMALQDLFHSVAHSGGGNERREEPQFVLQSIRSNQEFLFVGTKQGKRILFSCLLTTDELFICVSNRVSSLLCQKQVRAIGVSNFGL
jgi:hypothetical protein